VGGQVARETFEAVDHRPDVAVDVGEAPAAGGGDPSRVDEGVELGADVVDGGGEGGVGQLGQAALDLVGYGQDPLDRRHHVEGGGGQPAPDGRQQTTEFRLAPGGTGVRRDPGVGGRGGGT